MATSPDRNHAMPGNTDYAGLLAGFGSRKFSELRPAQTEVLGQYVAEDGQAPDVAIELPTGAGKSLIALLIGEAWRREGRSAAILTGNKTLARQMEQEAEDLGVPVVRLEGAGTDIPSTSKRAYQRAHALAIMNYWVYFNQNPAIDPAKLLVMDDAHLAEHCLDSLYSVTISRSEHASLFEVLVAELSTRFPDYAVLQDALDAESPPSTRTELLSFLDQQAAIDRIREICDSSPDMDAHADLRFRWTRLRANLAHVNIYASDRQLWLRPYIYPTRTNEHYAEAMQRIYMSATIGDPADLARRLGVCVIRKIAVGRNRTEETYGRRLLVMNRTEEGDLPERLQRIVVAALRIQPKSVWLCASASDATRYKQVVSEWLNANGFAGHPTWILTSLGNEIDAFKQSATGHFFVGGRFDGMDFEANECRLVVLATIPRAINLQEEFITAYLRDSGFMLRRLNYRLIQALGRCNRASDDYAVYVLADRRFATHFGRESNRLGIPGNIRAEIDLAEDMADAPVDESVALIGQFLSGEHGHFDSMLAERQAGTPGQATVTIGATDTSEAEIQAWGEMCSSENFDSAKGLFAECSRRASRAQQREMSAYYIYCQAKAAHLEGCRGNTAAQREAVDLLEQAVERGGRSSWFNRLRSSINRYRAGQGQQRLAAPNDYPDAVLQAFDERLEQWGCRGSRFQRWCERTKRHLQSESHAEFQEGLEQLGSILAYSASRPRHQASTDCRWRGVSGNMREVVTFEAKIEHGQDVEIYARDVGQAHNQHQRAVQQYDHVGYTIRGTIVTHLATIADEARASLGPIRIIPTEAVLVLFDKIVAILSQYRAGWSLEDLEARSASAERIRPLLPTAGWLTRSLSADDPFISAEGLLADWP